MAMQELIVIVDEGGIEVYRDLTDDEEKAVLLERAANKVVADAAEAELASHLATIDAKRLDDPAYDALCKVIGIKS